EVSDAFLQVYQQYDHFNVDPDNPQEEAAGNRIEEIGSEDEDLINLGEESDEDTVIEVLNNDSSSESSENNIVRNPQDQARALNNLADQIFNLVNQIKPTPTPQDIEKAFVANQVTDARKLSVIISYLKGPAATPNIDLWNDPHNRNLSFQPEFALESKWFSKLFTRKQYSLEAVDTYYTVIVELFRHVEAEGARYPNIAKVQIFVNGLHPELSVADMDSDIEKLNETLNNMLHHLKDQNKNFTKNQTHSNIVCFSCEHTGYIAPHCPNNNISHSNQNKNYQSNNRNFNNSNNGSSNYVCSLKIVDVVEKGEEFEESSKISEDEFEEEKLDDHMFNFVAFKNYLSNLNSSITSSSIINNNNSLYSNLYTNCLIETHEDIISLSRQVEIEKLLQNNANIFAYESHDLGKTEIVKHYIEPEKALTIKQSIITNPDKIKAIKEFLVLCDL
ncbi:11770_t:CDS:2, partial [Racocetra fulgida]